MYANGTSSGTYAVRWDAGTTTPTLPGNLGTETAGNNANTPSAAQFVNGTGTIAGYAYKVVGGASRGQRAVRWNAGSTTAVQFDILGSADGTGESQVDRKQRGVAPQILGIARPDTIRGLGGRGGPETRTPRPVAPGPKKCPRPAVPTDPTPADRYTVPPQERDRVAAYFRAIESAGKQK